MYDPALNRLLVLFLQCGAIGHQDILGLLQCPGGSDVPFIHEALLLILTYFTDHLLVEVFDDMEMVKHRLNPGAFFLKSLRKIGVHIAGDGFNVLHPIHPDMIDEIIDTSLAFALGNPEHMSGLQVDDMGGIPPTVMEQELVNTEKSCGFLRLFQCFAIDCVLFLESLLVDVLHYIFSQSGREITEKKGGMYLAAAPKEQQNAVLARFPQVREIWDDTFGDRMTKLVFIGKNMDQAAIEARLDACLSDVSI